jgi:hypothetical protein
LNRSLFFGGAVKILELDKRGELCERMGVNHTAESVPVSAATRPPPNKKLTPIRSDALPQPVNFPPGPPRSGWVQQDAGTNRRWRWPFRYRGSRRESAVAQLFSLVIIHIL